MNPDHLAELFDECLEHADPQARQAFIERSCGDDSALQNELQTLLASHDVASDFLETPVIAEAAALVPALLGSNLIGSRIGNWRVDSLLHAGGMGSVFRATRIEDDFTQTGALKLVRVGFETDELVSRFSRERQLLAQIEHPHIARLLDGGTTGEGLPWLSMEYVDGLAIDLYADHHCLTLRQRLDLFAQLADAVAYLHERLITHRDLKASNVLVDNNGHVRVLDFGIASLLDDAASNNEATAERRLSLATAAPEQLKGGLISTATDVYALGALLYRLLSGVAPYSIESGQTAAEIEHLICALEPPLASVLLERCAEAPEIASRRGTTARRLVAGLRGDLDIILAKALQKEPLRRYRSVTEFRADIESYCDNRPILARPNSAAYRSGRFLRRHWRGLSATAAIMLALTVGLGLALWQADEALRQRDRAQAMNSFMQEVLAEADPYAARGDKTVREALREASDLLDARFAGQPLLEASLRQAVGGVQLTLLDIDRGEANLERAMSLLVQALPRDAELYLRTESNLAWVDFERENYALSAQRYESVIERFTERHDAEFRAMVHNDVGVVLAELGRYADSIRHEELAMQLAPESEDRVATLINLGYAYDGLGELEKAKESYLLAIKRLRAQGDEGVVADLAHVLNNYGNVLGQQGRDEDALTFYLESLDIRYRVYGESTDSVAAQHLNVGRLLLQMQRPQEAIEHLEIAVEVFPDFRDADSIYTRLAQASLARAIVLTDPTPEQHDAAVATLAAISAALRADAGYRESQFVDQIEQWLSDASGMRKSG
ncbi:MAG: protein kinase [Congregibacter sp.]